jgi:U3 small nucleolar RNA-associated protein 21
MSSSNETNRKNHPRRPKSPILLPSLENARASDTPANEETQVTAADRSRVRKMDRNGADSQFTTLLRLGGESGDYEPIISHLKTLSAAADIEIRSLNPLQPNIELTLSCQFLTNRLRQRRDYELVQA